MISHALAHGAAADALKPSGLTRRIDTLLPCLPPPYPVQGVPELRKSAAGELTEPAPPPPLRGPPRTDRFRAERPAPRGMTSYRRTRRTRSWRLALRSLDISNEQRAEREKNAPAIRTACQGTRRDQTLGARGARRPGGTMEEFYKDALRLGCLKVRDRVCADAAFLDRRAHVLAFARSPSPFPPTLVSHAPHRVSSLSLIHI